MLYEVITLAVGRSPGLDLDGDGCQRGDGQRGEVFRLWRDPLPERHIINGLSVHRSAPGGRDRAVLLCGEMV